MSKGEDIFKPGWLREQCEKAKKDVDEWPQWMRAAWKIDERNDELRRKQ